jgi:probable HAF family extracellular repeat protein
MQDLGDLPGGSSSYARGINSFGHIVGISSKFAGFIYNPSAFLWTSAAGMQDLGTLPGDCYSSAYGINDLGRVVGVSEDCVFQDHHAFLWTSRGGMVNLGAWSPAAINNLGTAGLNKWLAEEKKMPNGKNSQTRHVTTGNVLDDLGFAAETALELKLKADLHLGILKLIRKHGYTPAS